jgi:site-specific DNA recombinase
LTTRSRGLKALQGYSAGGRTYGYKRAPIEHPTKLGVDGRLEIMAVKREIDENEAQWVRQIYEWFANGESPKKIAHKLNTLGIPSARGSTWAANAIYGDFKDGMGLLNNKIYIGQYIWNRSAWIKDPETGKRRRMKRDSKEWSVKEMEELRIIDQSLWDAVQARHLEIRQRSGVLREALNNPNSRSHSGKFLFSGLLQCSCCGANYTIYSTTSYACATNINRGDAACSNRLRAPRKLLEGMLLKVVQQELLSEEAIDIFVEETSKLLHQQNQKPKSEYAAHQRSLNHAEKQIANLMNAIKAGIITPVTKAELERAEAERERAKAILEAAAGMEEVLTTTLPEAAKRYRNLVADLGKTLQTDIGYARQCLKTLLGFVRLVPASAGGFLEAELRHSPEGLMRLALNNNIGFKARMVAGIGFEPMTFRL